MMYQIAVRDAKTKRSLGVVNSLTWKRLRKGHAKVRRFVVTDDSCAGVRFDYKDDADMVARALRQNFGLNVIVNGVERRRE